MWFAERGATVFTPLFYTSPHFDFIVEREGSLQRVQVKTSSVLRKGRWNITVCTRGGNRSWSGLVKHLDPTQYDSLFVVVADGRRWLIPSFEVDGGTGILLGGPKYERFEVDSGQPLVSRG